MKTRMGILKQAAIGCCCWVGVGAMPIAQADGFAVSVGTGPVYYQDYDPAYRYHRCYYDYYGYYRCRPYYAYPGEYGYYGGPYYTPGISIGYYGGGFHPRWRDRDDWRWRDRDRDRRWHR